MTKLFLGVITLLLVGAVSVAQAQTTSPTMSPTVSPTPTGTIPSGAPATGFGQ